MAAFFNYFKPVAGYVFIPSFILPEGIVVATEHTYTPDFVLPNNIILETNCIK